MQLYSENEKALLLIQFNLNYDTDLFHTGKCHHILIVFTFT